MLPIKARLTKIPWKSATYRGLIYCSVIPTGIEPVS